jgi:hypothetical protein
MPQTILPAISRAELDRAFDDTLKKRYVVPRSFPGLVECIVCRSNTSCPYVNPSVGDSHNFELGDDYIRISPSLED